MRGLDYTNIQNLIVTADGDVKGLLDNSTAVISFGSTVMLEAAASGDMMIIPIFAEAAEGGMESKNTPFPKTSIHSIAPILKRNSRR